MPVITGERELDGLVSDHKGLRPNPLPAILGSTPGSEREPQAEEGLLAGTVLPWERRQ
jgi:hypothetical protein